MRPTDESRALLGAHRAEGVFQPEDLCVLAAAFDEAWEELEKSRLYLEADYQRQWARDTLGKYIIEEAKKGQRDIARLRDGALLLYRSYAKAPPLANRPLRPVRPNHRSLILKSTMARR
jgi:hypothetical protein